MSVLFKIYSIGIDAPKVGLVVCTAKFKIECNELRFSNCLQNIREASVEVVNCDIYDILNLGRLHNNCVTNTSTPGIVKSTSKQKPK